MNTIINIIYTSIIERKFEDADDILDDIQDRNQSHLITTISQKIENNKSIKYEWNDEDNNNLYEILIKIYKNKIIDINKYDKQIFDINPFIERAVNIAKQINQTIRKKMDIENVRKLLNDIDLKEASLKHITETQFIEKSNAYKIKPHHAKKIYTKLIQVFVVEDDVKFIYTFLCYHICVYIYNIFV